MERRRKKGGGKKKIHPLKKDSFGGGVYVVKPQRGMKKRL